METKWTKGPWEWAGNYLSGGERGVDAVLLVADDGRPYGMHRAVLECEPQDRALISAAPDLAEVAAGAYGWLKALPKDQQPDAAWFAPLEAALRKAGAL